MRMKQITKAEFIRRVTKNRTIFIGVSRDGNEAEHINKNIQEYLSTRAPRYAICLSNSHLVFGVTKPSNDFGFINDSHLSLADVTPHTFCKCYEDNGILIVELAYRSDDFVNSKYLYYKEVG